MNALLNNSSTIQEIKDAAMKCGIGKEHIDDMIQMNLPVNVIRKSLALMADNVLSPRFMDHINEDMDEKEMIRVICELYTGKKKYIEKGDKVTCYRCPHRKIWYDANNYTMRLSCTCTSKRGKCVTYSSYPTYRSIKPLVQTEDTIESITQEFIDYSKRRLAPLWCPIRKDLE